MTNYAELYSRRDNNDDYIIAIIHEDNNPSHAVIGFKKPLLNVEIEPHIYDDDDYCIVSSPYCNHIKGITFLADKGLDDDYTWTCVMPTYYGFVNLLRIIKNNYNMIGYVKKGLDGKIETKSELDVVSYCDWRIVRNYYELLVFHNFDEIFA